MIAPGVDRWAPYDELVWSYGASYFGAPLIGPQTREQFEEASRWARIWIAMRGDTYGLFVWD
jgi:hypothetical protein